MRISGDEPYLVIDSLSSQMGTMPPRHTDAGRTQGQEADPGQLNLSPRAKAMQKVGQLLAHPPEERETKVAALKQELENGRYAVKADQVAEHLMKAHLLNLVN